MSDFIAAASRFARRGGAIAFVFIGARFAELVSTMREHQLEPKRIRFVHPYRDAPATTVLIEARKGGGIEAAVEAPLILYDAPGVYTAEAREMLVIS